jgi:hypothetical protein
MEFIRFLQEALISQVPEIIATYEGEVAAGSLSEMETAVKAMSQVLGGEVLEQWLAAQTPQYPEDTVSCPHCGEQAAYVRWREGKSITLLGRVTYRRPYYQCGGCQRGHAPLDKALGIAPGQMSHEVQQLAALMGIHASFAMSRDLLRRTAQIELSPNSIRKACQQVGAKVMQQEADWQVRSQDYAAQREHKRQVEKPKQMYGSLDGFMAHIAGEWHEMKAGVWWMPGRRSDGSLRAERISYYTDWQPAATFGDLTWATGFQRQADQAETVIFVADGAEWIWRIVQEHFPEAVQIVDWYHALTYLQAVAQAAFTNADARTIWLEQQYTSLWHGRRSAVFHACRQLVATAPEAVKKALTFFARQRSRMRYDRFRDLGFQIGSGTMESGCKQLGAGRLKIAGAQWSETGARLVAKARAAYLSGQWDQLTASASPLPLVA